MLLKCYLQRARIHALSCVHSQASPNSDYLNSGVRRTRTYEELTGGVSAEEEPLQRQQCLASSGCTRTCVQLSASRTLPRRRLTGRPRHLHFCMRTGESSVAPEKTNVGAVVQTCLRASCFFPLNVQGHRAPITVGVLSDSHGND